MRISDWSSDVCSSDLRGPPYARATTVRGHTMHFKPEEIPLITPESGSGGGGCMRSIKAGEMEIGFTWTTGPRDYTPLYAVLPGGVCPCDHYGYVFRSEEHTSELQTLMRNSYAVCCLKKEQAKNYL